MNQEHVRGIVYRCPVCGAELAVLARGMGVFAPHCCNKPMDPTEERVLFYVCPVCKAEIGVINPGKGEFTPHCCNVLMDLAA